MLLFSHPTGHHQGSAREDSGVVGMFGFSLRTAFHRVSVYSPLSSVKLLVLMLLNVLFVWSCLNIRFIVCGYTLREQASFYNVMGGLWTADLMD